LFLIGIVLTLALSLYREIKPIKKLK
jgi:hypothetical protein